MMFHNLPRFSVDLDFTLTDKSVEKAVYNRLFSIAIEYGRIVDDNLGFFGPKIVISYGDNREWNLKIEVSNRDFGEEYEVLSLNGSPIKVMKLEDMYANKLVALTERKGVANRDIFDINFFEELGVSPRERVIEIRTGLNLREYLPKILEVLKAYHKNRILSSLAPLLTPEYQKWAKQNLLPVKMSSILFTDIGSLSKKQRAIKYQRYIEEDTQGDLPSGYTHLKSNGSLYMLKDLMFNLKKS